VEGEVHLPETIVYVASSQTNWSPTTENVSVTAASSAAAIDGSTAKQVTTASAHKLRFIRNPLPSVTAGSTSRAGRRNYSLREKRVHMAAGHATNAGCRDVDAVRYDHLRCRDEKRRA
jgi:hypothetical protein